MYLLCINSQFVLSNFLLENFCSKKYKIYLTDMKFNPHLVVVPHSLG